MHIDEFEFLFAPFRSPSSLPTLVKIFLFGKNAPGVCTNSSCYELADVPPRCCHGMCERCGTPTVISAVVLGLMLLQVDGVTEEYRSTVEDE